MQTTKERFLRDFRRALGLLSPEVDSADPPHLKFRVNKGSMERADLWLTSSYFDDYRKEDFEDLSAEKLQALDDLVHQFRAVADQVPSDCPATQKQHCEGKAIMEKIYEILESHVKGLVN